MTVVILDEAEREFLSDARYYESKETGLGVRFRHEVAAIVDWISQHHDLPRLRAGRYRRVNLRSFPHYVAYIQRDDTLWIVAIASAYKQPEYWIHRF